MTTALIPKQTSAPSSSRKLGRSVALASSVLALACTGAHAQSHGGGFHGGGFHGGGGYHGGYNGGYDGGYHGGYYRGGGCGGFAPFWGLGVGLGLGLASFVSTTMAQLRRDRPAGPALLSRGPGADVPGACARPGRGAGGRPDLLPAQRPDRRAGRSRSPSVQPLGDSPSRGRWPTPASSTGPRSRAWTGAATRRAERTVPAVPFRGQVLLPASFEGQRPAWPRTRCVRT